MIKITHLSNAIGCDKGGGIGTVVRDYLSCNKGPTIKEQLWFPGSNNLKKELKKYGSYLNRVKLICVFGKINSHKLNLIQIIKELKSVDIIHQHSLWMFPSLVSLFFSKYMKGKLIIQPHGALAPRAMQRSWYKKNCATTAGTAIAAGGIAKGHAVLRMRLKLMPPEGLTRTLQNLS